MQYCHVVNSMRSLQHTHLLQPYPLKHNIQNGEDRLPTYIEMSSYSQLGAVLCAMQDPGSNCARPSLSGEATCH